MDTETINNKTLLANRFKSFAWRLGAYAVVSLIGFIVDNLGLLDLSPQIVTVVALILGEITKWIKVQNNLGKIKNNA